MAADRFVRLTMWLGFGVSAVVFLTEWALALTLQSALGAWFGRSYPLLVSPSWLLAVTAFLFLVAFLVSRRANFSLEHALAYQAVVIVALFGATMILVLGTVLHWPLPRPNLRW